MAFCGDLGQRKRDDPFGEIRAWVLLYVLCRRALGSKGKALGKILGYVVGEWVLIWDAVYNVDELVL